MQGLAACAHYRIGAPYMPNAAHKVAALKYSATPLLPISSLRTPHPNLNINPKSNPLGLCGSASVWRLNASGEILLQNSAVESLGEVETVGSSASKDTATAPTEDSPTEDSPTEDSPMEESPPSEESVPEKMMKVKFVLEKECRFGQTFNLIGNDALFGNWDPKESLLMTWSEGHNWSVELNVPVGKEFEYKFIMTGKRGELEWQPGMNRTFVALESSSPLVITEPWDAEGDLVAKAEVETTLDDKSEVESKTEIGEEDLASPDTSIAEKSEDLLEVPPPPPLLELNPETDSKVSGNVITEASAIPDGLVELATEIKKLGE